MTHLHARLIRSLDKAGDIPYFNESVCAPGKEQPLPLLYRKPLALAIDECGQGAPMLGSGSQVVTRPLCPLSSVLIELPELPKNDVSRLGAGKQQVSGGLSQEEASQG